MEYQLAYDYLITSDAFRELDADASKVFMNRYSSHTYSPAGGDEVTQTVRFGFLVKLRSFEVVCHKEDGVWQVCEDCTAFE